jgi:hypothetical protein
MRLETFAEIFMPDHPMVNAQGGGINFAGHLLRDVLRENGGRYQAKTELSDGIRDSVLRAAKLTKDNKLAAMASANSFVISLEHMRDLDPNTTRIVYGLRIHKDPEDGQTPGIGP